jgi:hypothetical protein
MMLTSRHRPRKGAVLTFDIKQTDASVREVLRLSPVDLAVSKISRFSSQDRDDIPAPAKHRLIESAAFNRRSQEALKKLRRQSRESPRLDQSCLSARKRRRATAIGDLPAARGAST